RRQLQNMEPGIDLADIELAVREHRRALRVLAVVERPKRIARVGVKPIHIADLVADNKRLFIEDRRSEFDLDAIHFPDALRLAVLNRGPVQADHAALRVPFVLLTVADVDTVAGHDRRAVHRSLAEDIAPDLLARVHVEGVDGAVTAATDEEPL